MKALLVLATLLHTSSAQACSVCFGGADGRGGLARGFWWGIVLLLAITMSLVGAIGWTLWTVENRRARTNA